VSSPDTSSSSSGRTTAAVILAIIAILFLVAGVIYLVEPAKSLPSFMGQMSHSSGHRPLRATGSLIAGVVFAVGAWFAKSYKPKQGSASSSKESTPAGHA
jgi:amino acid permease